MSEEKEKLETPEDTGEGIQPGTNRLVDDTNLAAKRLEEATEAATKERLATEESYAKMKLGGRAEAGQPMLTGKEARQAEAQKIADEITSAFT